MPTSLENQRSVPAGLSDPLLRRPPRSADRGLGSAIPAIRQPRLHAPPDVDLLPIRSSWTDCLLAAAAVLVCRVLAIIPCHLYDDAFITMRIADNFAAGRGLVYNPGAPWEPVLGTTTPAYAVFLAGAAKLGLDLSTFVVLFSAACDAATAILIMRLFAGGRRLSGWLAMLALAFVPELNRNAAGGMETSFFVLVLLSAASLNASGRLFAAGLVGVLAPMVRPEGVLLLPILVVSRLHSPRSAARLLMPAVPLGLIYVGALTWYFGSPIPNSLMAKADLYAGSGGWTRIREILAASFVPSWPLLAALPLVIFGGWRCLRMAGPARVFSVFALLVTVAYLAARPMMFGWYYQPILTADCIWLGIGLAGAVERLTPALSRALNRRWRVFSIASASAAVCGVAAVAYHMGPSRIRSEIYSAMQSWAERNAGNNTTILACDIGCIGYESKARILDTGGLVWPTARRRTNEPELLKEYQPDYALIIASPGRIRAMQTDPDLVRLYVPVERFNVGDDRRLVFPEKDLSREARRRWAVNWRHDYILYARRDRAVHD